MVEQLQKTVESILQKKEVKLVAGYELNSNQQVTPVFIEKPEEAKSLVWNEHCVFNLARYLPEMLDYVEEGKVGIVAKGCDVKAITGLIQENQVDRDRVVIIGMDCFGQKEEGKEQFKTNCPGCQVHCPPVYDHLIEDKQQNQEAPAKEEKEDPLEAKSPEERWEYWQKQFSKCIRCYACREVCPMCYCSECVVDSNQPQWCSPLPVLSGNYGWNMIRAFHLAGRCVECGECERACPVDIPLMKLNRKMAREVKEQFDYTPGESWEAPLPLNDFKKEEEAEFIK